MADGELIPRSPQLELQFLLALEASGNVKTACLDSGATHGQVYGWRERDEYFKAKWDEALIRFGGRIRKMLNDQALEKKNLKAIMVLDKIHNREDYEVAARGGGTIQIQLHIPRSVPLDEIPVGDGGRYILDVTPDRESSEPRTDDEPDWDSLFRDEV